MYQNNNDASTKFWKVIFVLLLQYFWKYFGVQMIFNPLLLQRESKIAIAQSMLLYPSCIISLQYSIIVVKSWQYIILYHGISKWGTLVLLSLLIFTSCLSVCKGKVFTLQRINIQGNWAAHLTTEYSYKHNPLQVQSANGPDRYIMPLKTSAN